MGFEPATVAFTVEHLCPSATAAFMLNKLLNYNDALCLYIILNDWPKITGLERTGYWPLYQKPIPKNQKENLF